MLRFSILITLLANVACVKIPHQRGQQYGTPEWSGKAWIEYAPNGQAVRVHIPCAHGWHPDATAMGCARDEITYSATARITGILTIDRERFEFAPNAGSGELVAKSVYWVEFSDPMVRDCIDLKSEQLSGSVSWRVEIIGRIARGDTFGHFGIYSRQIEVTRLLSGPCSTKN